MYYVYKKNAGQVGTEECWLEAEELSSSEEWVIATDNAMSYGNEQDEDGEWEYSEPECWLEAKCETIEDLEPYMGELIYGNDTEEAFIARLKRGELE